MENKINNLKKERQNIIKSYSNKPIASTYIDEFASQFSKNQQVLVKDIIKESPDTKSFILIPNKELKTTELAPFKAGQYVSIQVSINGLPTSRAYSLSSSPSYAIKNIYRLTIKRVTNGLVSNYLLDNIKIGDSLTISKPMGDFCYNKNRDSKNIIAIAGGSGITPFMSLAGAIDEAIEDLNLTVIYSVKTFNDIFFKKEIMEINKKSKKVKFLITLTKEEKEGFLHGHITKEMLSPFIKEENTIFMCGPRELYRSMNDVLSAFKIPKKSVHYENFNVKYTPSEESTYELKVILKNDFVLAVCRSDETLLTAMEKANIKAPSMCRVGTCGFCRSILLEGKIKMIGGSLKKAESDNDYIHPCVSYPESDIVLRLDI